MQSLIINQQKIPYELRRSARAKRLRLQIESDKPLLVVVAPKYAMEFQIKGFLKRQETWIEKNWTKVAKKAAGRPKRQGADGDVYFYFGEPLQLKLIPSLSWKPAVKVRGRQMEIALHKAISETEGKKAIKKGVAEFYKAKAAEVIHDRLQFFNEYYGLEYRQVTFRNQKTRWGSCSSNRNLNFNWRLIMAPIEVIDYVVVHELCHLRYMNHSAAFWRLVGEKITDHKERKKWLKENSFLLSL
ncbi:MAG: M48 family metallopeptidase [Candidatus Peregrinibacteria bacterium]|nr:M48 family metallopeptidase [Candidatus Peregrinibacteria bacterium]